MNRKFRKLACVCLTAVMASTFVSGNVLAFAEGSNGAINGFRYDTVTAEDVTGKIDLSGIALKNLNSSVLEAAGLQIKQNGTYTVIVTLDQNSVLDSLTGSETVSDYLSTFSGARTLDAIENSQKAFYNKLDRSGISYTRVNSYSTITNSVAIKVKWADIPKLTTIPSVESVVLSSTYAYPEAADTSNEKASAVTNPNDVYSTGIYDSSKYVAEGKDGSGVTIAILDTGLDYTHPAFSIMPDEVALTKNDVTSLMNNTAFEATKLSGATADDVYINAKVPFAYDYADKDPDVYPSYSQHGVHVAGISAGDSPEGYTDKDGNYVDELFKGVAPKAQLVICKVFTDDFDSSDLGGADTEDILAALEDCVNLGVDVINMSLGTSGGFSSVSIEGDTEGEWLNRVYTKVNETGISLICAASNEFSAGYGSAFGTNLTTNPDSGTVGSPSTFVGAMSVASINGQTSYYMNVETSSGDEPVFFTAASDINYVRQDFLKLLNVGSQPQKFQYVVVPGKGRAGDYSSVKSYFDNKGNNKIIAVIERGSTTFQDKIEIAMRMGADAAIIYNNVAGAISVSLGDIDDPIPTASVTMDAGAIFKKAGTTGYVTLSSTYQAGPFMNDYSSWGSTPDLQLKPDITAYGGEITSAVSGGFSEMSGTSMASPNLAGFTALLRSKLKSEGYTGIELTHRINQLIMSTATTIYSEENLPYSPRKQGAGLATLENVFNTQAYLYTTREDGRPKAELGEDKNKKGVYDITFFVNNFGASDLSFSAKSIFMTESLSSNGLSVAEKAYMLDDNAAVWTVDGKNVAEGSAFTVKAGQTAEIKVTLTLSDAEKKYLDSTFENGMYVEGFLKLESNSNGQCGLTLPFMGFYGDWKSAPMLDYNCYEIAEFEQDTSYTDETRPQAQVWATQAFASYYTDRYVIPMGSYVYVQDPNAEQIYTNMEYASVSCFNEFLGDESNQNHMTTWRIKSLYAGLLRNAELVTYDMYNTDTGELIVSDNVYRVNKAYAGGGTATPAQVLLEIEPATLGLEANGRYSFEFHFYFNAEDKDDPEYNNDENTFSMIFYVDYESPVLESSAIRYYDYKENNQDKQRVYLDLNIYDNHYAQAVMLCYPTDDLDSIIMATEYITPVYNPVKNGTTTVTIDVTDIIDEYRNMLFVQVVDYALNYSVYQLSFSGSNEAVLPDTFKIADDDRITEIDGEKVLTISLNEAYKINLDFEGDANLSNFTWRSVYSCVQVKNGEVFGAALGTSTITVTGKNGYNQKIKVVVVEGNATAISPTITFGTIKNFDDGIQKAIGTVKVGAGQSFTLSVIFEPWYYPTEGTSYVWSSSNEKIATVDQSGNVTIFDTKGSATIQARLYDKSGSIVSTASVTLSVQEPFTISGSQLTRYHGSGGDLVIPTDKNVMTIATEAFKDNDNITSIVIPSTVTQIGERAFKNCTALEYVYFVSKTGEEADNDSDLATILKNAFEGCPKLKVVDLTNVKTITLTSNVFLNCTSLEEVIAMEKIGTMTSNAFAGCTSLKTANITGLHTSGNAIFKNCTSLEEVTTGFYTSIGSEMFSGCTSLKEITLYTNKVSERAFYNCNSLESVKFDNSDLPDGYSFDISIAAEAFASCKKLVKVDFGGNRVISIGDAAFSDCTNLTGFDMSVFTTDVALGDKVFENSPVTFDTAVYVNTTLLIAPSVITGDFAIREGTTEIAAYAFSSSTLAQGVTQIAIPSTVTKIGEGAFAYLGITSITLPESITEIPDYAFYWNNSLTSITIPAGITSIGSLAFYGCESLSSVTFADNSKLSVIGDEAFAFCFALRSIELPDGCAVMGDAVFYNCVQLKSAKLPSLTYLGRDTFWNCSSLEQVTFGANASTAGTYTFIETPVTSVTFGDNTLVLGEGVFYSCLSLTSINLKNIIETGDYTFANCLALTTVTGLENLVTIGDYSFANCTGLKTLTLTKAEIIGEGAFSGVGFTSLSIPAVKEIGSLSFYGASVTAIELPDSLTKVGAGAFADSSVIRFAVSEDNKIFFTDNGVLYRNIENFVTGETAYELTAYPSAKTVAEYEILENTVIVKANAFAALRGTVQRIIFPYSLKAIGDSAFLSSGITSYEFTSVEAPALYAEYYDNGYPFYAYFYTNFENEFIIQAGVSSGEIANISIKYPVNGKGYDNYVYSNYFTTVEAHGDEVLESDTFELKNMIESFYSVEEVKGWNDSSFEVNEANTKVVKEFADKVAVAHSMYLNITSETQLDLLGSANIEKLLTIEETLKDVKVRFGIQAIAVSLEVSADSTHKTEYKAGEKFDMTGLVITVNYDDYSTETVNYSSGLITLGSAYDNVELTTLNRYVIVYVYGLEVRVAITVTDETIDPNPVDENGKLNPAVIYGPIIGVVAVALIAVAAVLVIKKSKSKSANNNEEISDNTENADGEKEE